MTALAPTYDQHLLSTEEEAELDDALRGVLPVDEALAEYTDDELLELGQRFTEEAENLTYMRGRAAMEYSRRAGQLVSDRTKRLLAFAKRCGKSRQIILADIRIVKMIPESIAGHLPGITRGHLRAAIELTSRKGEPITAPERQQRTVTALVTASQEHEGVTVMKERLKAEKARDEAPIYQQNDGSDVLGSLPAPGTTGEILERLTRLERLLDPQREARELARDLWEELSELGTRGLLEEFLCVRFTRRWGGVL